MDKSQEFESMLGELRETVVKLWSKARLLELAVLGLYEKSNRGEISLAEVEPMCELASEVERLAGNLDNGFPTQGRIILPAA